MVKGTRCIILAILVFVLQFCAVNNMVFGNGETAAETVGAGSANVEACTPISNDGQVQSSSDDAETKENRIIVQYKEKGQVGKDLGSFITSRLVSRETATDTIELLKTATSKALEEVMEELRKDPKVDFVERDHERNIQATLDPDFGQQWYLTNIEAEKGWGNMPQQKKKVVVAVIDTGIDVNHPDLKNRIEPGGYNFIMGDTYMFDSNGHGTEVSGIIAAEADNYAGITGVSGAYDVKILPLKAAYFDGKIFVVDEVKAIDYAIEKKVDVINLSLGNEMYSNIENAAIQRAINSGIVVVASAGNEANKAYSYSYPASYDNVISVGSIDQNNVISHFSNYNDRIDVVAPGEGIYTTERGSTYTEKNGTSFSVPIVSGIAAILKGIDPNLTAARVRKIIQQSAIDLGTPGKDDFYGYGRVDLNNAVSSMYNVLDISLNQYDLSLDLGQTQELVATVNPDSALNKELRWTSSDPEIVQVDDKGNITGLKQGNAVITVMAGTENVVARCKVKVEESYPWVNASINSGVYRSPQQIQFLSTKGEELAIYYTTDGTNPTVASSRYNGYVAVDQSEIIKCIAVDRDGRTSSVYSFTYVIDESEDEILKWSEEKDLDKKWTIRFNKEIDFSSVNDQSIYIQDISGNRRKDCHLTKGENDKIVVVAAETNYQIGKIYCLVITDQIKGSGGNGKLEKTARYYFSFKR